MRVEKKKKRGIVIAIIVIVLVIVGAGLSMFYGLLPDVFGVFGPKIIKVGIFDLDLPPLFYEDDEGNLVGFEIDLLNEVADRLNWEVEYVRVDDKYGDALNAKEVDVVWGNVPDLEEIRENLLLTKPYLRTNQVAVVAKDSGIEKKEDLNSREYFTVRWTPADILVKHRTFEIIGTQITASRYYLSTSNSLQKELSAAILCDETISSYMLDELGEGFVVLQEPLGEVNYVIAFRPNDSKTCNKVQSVLDDIAADGIGKSLSEYWFGKDLFIH